MLIFAIFNTSRMENQPIKNITLHQIKLAILKSQAQTKFIEENIRSQFARVKENASRKSNAISSQSSRNIAAINKKAQDEISIIQKKANRDIAIVHENAKYAKFMVQQQVANRLFKVNEQAKDKLRLESLIYEKLKQQYQDCKQLKETQNHNTNPQSNVDEVNVKLIPNKQTHLDYRPSKYSFRSLGNKKTKSVSKLQKN